MRSISPILVLRREISRFLALVSLHVIVWHCQLLQWLQFLRKQSAKDYSKTLTSSIMLWRSPSVIHTHKSFSMLSFLHIYVDRRSNWTGSPRTSRNTSTRSSTSISSKRIWSQDDIQGRLSNDWWKILCIIARFLWRNCNDIRQYSVRGVRLLDIGWEKDEYRLSLTDCHWKGLCSRNSMNC